MFQFSATRLSILFAIALFCPFVASAQPTNEVEHVARQVLEAISTRDSTLFRSLFLPDAQIAIPYTRDGKRTYATRPVDADVEMLGQDGPVFLERMWEPEIRVDGFIASVWTRYDFYVDGAFSHCGTDAFHLLNTEEGWKVISLIYSIESDAEKCPESPLGNP